MRKRVSTFCFIISGGFLIAGTWLSAGVGNQPGKATRTLSLEERVAYQRKVEEVYWRHNTWSNPTAKPKLEEVLPSAILRARVEESLREGVALETRFGHSITAGQLQAEVERMARQTKQPGVLRELFDALDNDSL